MEFRKEARRVIKMARMGAIQYGELHIILVDLYMRHFKKYPRSICGE
jgi:hypothetical protein